MNRQVRVRIIKETVVQARGDDISEAPVSGIEPPVALASKIRFEVLPLIDPRAGRAEKEASHQPHVVEILKESHIKETPVDSRGRIGSTQCARQVRDFITELGEMKPGALVTEKGLATMFCVHPITIKRMVDRGELPVPVKMGGKPTWTVGAILQHIENRLKSAAEQSRIVSLQHEKQGRRYNH